MTATELRYIDSDGHILEHPTAMPDYAPAEYRDRIWHIETDEAGEEWLHYNGNVMPANGLAAAGTAGLSDEERAELVPRRACATPRCVPRRTTPRRASRTWTQDGIDLAVLYPTMLLGLQSVARRRLRRGAGARVQRLVLGPHPGGRGSAVRCGRGAADARARRRRSAVAAEIRRVAELPGMVSVFMRPNPSVDWRPFNDPVYDPIWQAAADTGLPIALHPFLAPDLPGRVRRPAPGAAPYAPTAATSTTSTPTTATRSKTECGPVPPAAACCSRRRSPTPST